MGRSEEQGDETDLGRCGHPAGVRDRHARACGGRLERREREALLRFPGRLARGGRPADRRPRGRVPHERRLRRAAARAREAEPPQAVAREARLSRRDDDHADRRRAVLVSARLATGRGGRVPAWPPVARRVRDDRHRRERLRLPGAAVRAARRGQHLDQPARHPGRPARGGGPRRADLRHDDVQPAARGVAHRARMASCRRSRPSSCSSARSTSLFVGSISPRA